jgi:hypothetical protein
MVLYCYQYLHYHALSHYKLLSHFNNKLAFIAQIFESHPSHLTFPGSGNHYYNINFCELNFLISQVSEIMQYFSLCAWHNSLKVRMSSSFHAISIEMISLFHCRRATHCECATHFLYPFLNFRGNGTQELHQIDMLWSTTQ